MGRILDVFNALGNMPCSIDLLNRRVKICVRTGPPSLAMLEVFPYISPALLSPRSRINSSISWGSISDRYKECTLGFLDSLGTWCWV